MVIKNIIFTTPFSAEATNVYTIDVYDLLILDQTNVWANLNF